MMARSLHWSTVTGKPFNIAMIKWIRFRAVDLRNTLVGAYRRDADFESH
jgi:hypothetical protein